MTGEEERMDERLMEGLRDLATRLDPIPAPVAQAAKDAYTWRTVDEELAALTYDSSEAPVAGVRARSGPQALTFEAAHLSVEVEVEAAAPGVVRLVGQIAPPQPSEIEVRHRDGTTVVEADDLGRFEAPAIPSGPASLRCRRLDGGPVVTEWITV